MANLTQQNTTIAQLYAALFNRAPDAAGFTFWVQAYENGASLDTLVQSFLTSPEALAIYPTNQTNTQFVTAFYTSVFGRGPDPEGLTFWAAALASNGGSASPAARSLLIQQITAVVATPLNIKPAGISDTAYAQTVADRAMFANKIEFGVYFATELKSNDTTLAKSTMLLVTNIPGSLAAARELATGGPAPVPTLDITSADLVADIIAKLAAYPGSSGTVDAATMSAAQLAAVAAGTSKIAANGITNLTLPLGDALITDIFATALLGKTSAAKIDATGVDSAKLVLLSTSLANVADEGIIGTLGLNDGLSIAQLTTLLGAKTGLAANVQVNATTMDPTKLAVLTAAGAKVDGITGALALTSAINETDIGTLAGKYTGTTALVNASTMTTGQLVAAAAAAGKVAVGGITSLALALASVDDTATAALLSKAAGATVVATGGSDLETASLVTNLGNVAANGITGTLAITSAVTDTNITALLAKYPGTGVTANVTNMVAAQLNALSAANTKISTTGITGVLALSASEDAVAANLLAKAAGTLNVVATDGTAAEVASLVINLGNVAADGITGTLAITSAVADTNITALLAKYSGNAATVNVTGMVKAQLDALLVSTDKISTTGITGTLALNASEDAVAANLLAKAAPGTLNVVATDGTAAEVASLVTNVGNIATGGITGDLALSNGLSDAQLIALLGTKTADAANVQVNASGMGVDKLLALSNGIAKVDGISGLSLSLADLSGTVAAAENLLSKASGATVVATGSTAAQIAALATYIDNVAIDGVTGNVALTNDLTADQLGKLLGTKTAAAANVVVDATDWVDGTKLAALANGIGKVDALDKLSLDLNLVGDSVSLVLLDKGSAGMRAATTGASTAEVAKLLDKISLFGDGGLSGAMTLTSAQLLATTPLTLNPKLASGFALSVVGDANDNVINLTELTQGVTVSGGAGVDTITLGAGTDTVILGDQLATRSQPFVETDVNTLKIDKIVNLERTDKIQLSTERDAYGAGITFSSETVLAGDDTLPSLWFSGFTPATFADLVSQLNSSSSSIPRTASTSAVAQVSYIYFQDLTPGRQESSLKGGYLIINDDNPTFDVNDTFISLSGLLSNGALSGVLVFKDMFVFG